MTQICIAIFSWYLLVAALVAFALFGWRVGPNDSLEVALTALMWPLYALVLAGAAMMAVCAIGVCAIALLGGWLRRLFR